jgi:hypothetical protein
MTTDGGVFTRLERGWDLSITHMQLYRYHQRSSSGHAKMVIKTTIPIGSSSGAEVAIPTAKVTPAPR